MSLGPVIVDLAGTELSNKDIRRLQHPQVGGVILFTRNYVDPEQLRRLVEDIHHIRSPRLLVTVDQEGGRVQRFREGFQTLPAMGLLGEVYDHNADQALNDAEQFGWLMATELLQYGIDLSFAPVLDLGHTVSTVIGDRAFHTKPAVTSHLANRWIRGMRAAGMEAVGKHFPGHGSVAGDSHHVMPYDKRDFDRIWAQDLLVFRNVINTHLAAMMMAHVIYDRCDQYPAGYSRFWVEQVLRGQLGFEGVVFSDDLSMSGAESIGDYPARAHAALEAGCDQILVCNNSDGADEVLDSLKDYNNPVSQARLIRLHAHSTTQRNLTKSPRWLKACERLAEFNSQPHQGDSDDLFL